MPPPEFRLERSARIRLLAGAALVLAGLAAHVAARHHWRDRLPAGWAWTSVFVGIATPPGPDGEFPARDAAAIYERSLVTDEATRRRNEVIVTDRYLNRDPRTRRVIYNYTVRFSVDPRTGRHRPPHGNDYLVFPRGTQRRTYAMRASYLRGTPLAFAGEDELEGLRVYRFRYEGPMEYTDFYRGSADAPGLAIPPGQEIRCLDDRFELTYWVEPVTGMVVRMAEACHSFDAQMDRTTRAVRGNVLRWSGESSGNDVVRRVEEAWEQRLLMRATRVYLPLALVLPGALLVALALRDRLRAARKPRA